jgi:hypothetical protein
MILLISLLLNMMMKDSIRVMICVCAHVPFHVRDCVHLPVKKEKIGKLAYW